MEPPESEYALTMQIAVMFFDFKTVDSIAADYATSVIKMVRDFDARQKEIQKETQDGDN